MMFRRRRKKSTKVNWEAAPDVKERLVELIQKLKIDWVPEERIYTVRSSGSSARAYARIWGMSKVWQVSAGLPAIYTVEVVSQYFDKLPRQEQDKVLLHELAHIPKNFSGALVAHNHTKGGFHDKLKTMLASYKKIEK